MVPLPQAEPPFRREKLYTFRLIPGPEVPIEVWNILFEGREYPVAEEAYPWFFARDDEDREGLLSYAQELDCLHEDLDFALIDLEIAQEDSYSDRLMRVDASMYFRRLALIYHTENVDLRIYAYREKVFKLVRHFYGVKGISDDDSRFKDRIRSELRQRGVGALVSRLDTLGDPLRVSAAFERRKLSTHGLKPNDAFRFLTSTARFDDVVAGLSTTDTAQRYMNLDLAYRQRWSEIDELCASLAQFRFDLVLHLTGADS